MVVYSKDSGVGRGVERCFDVVGLLLAPITSTYSKISFKQRYAEQNQNKGLFKVCYGKFILLHSIRQSRSKFLAKLDFYSLSISIKHYNKCFTYCQDRNSHIDYWNVRCCHIAIVVQCALSTKRRSVDLMRALQIHEHYG